MPPREKMLSVHANMNYGADPHTQSDQRICCSPSRSKISFEVFASTAREIRSPQSYLHICRYCFPVHAKVVAACSVVSK